MTQISPQSGNASSKPGDDSRQDPAMRSLYRMSRTAGVGMQDYAAVNVLAVVGVLLGAASVLVLIFDDVLPMLLVPLAAIVVSVIAFIQVRKSNGTQTGAALALVGILIAGGLAGKNVYGRVVESTQKQRDEQQLRALIDTFGTDVIAGKNREAYELFDKRFQEAIGFETFDRTVTFRVSKLFVDKPVTKVDLGERVFIYTDQNGLTKADALLRVHGDGVSPEGILYQTQEQIEFRLVEGEWKIHGIMNWFEAPPPKAR